MSKRASLPSLKSILENLCRRVEPFSRNQLGCWVVDARFKFDFQTLLFDFRPLIYLDHECAGHPKSTSGRLIPGMPCYQKKKTKKSFSGTTMPPPVIISLIVTYDHLSGSTWLLNWLLHDWEWFKGIITELVVWQNTWSWEWLKGMITKLVGVAKYMIMEWFKVIITEHIKKLTFFFGKS